MQKVDTWLAYWFSTPILKIHISPTTKIGGLHVTSPNWAISYLDSNTSMNEFYSSIIFIISRRALAREGDYEIMPVCAYVRACVRALVSHADSSKTTTARDFL